MKKIDWYIFKRYLITFTAMLFMFIPIGIIIDVSEKINRMIENKVAFKDVLVYYYGFTIYFANLLFPIFLFLSIIWFTSKLANNSEIIAILSSGISFTRFLRPYLIGATLVSFVTLLMGFFILPDASEKYWAFRYEYLKNNVDIKQTSDIFRQVKPNEYLYVSSYNDMSKTGFDFIYEKFNDNKLEYKLYANRVKYNERTKDYTMFNYVKRTVGKNGDIIDKHEKITRKFEFEPDDLTPVIYVAETMNIFDLVNFIDKERAKGSSNLDVYLVVLYKKFSIPASAFILTIIAVAVSAMKRRGGMGVNLAIGILVAFSFVFFDKIFGTLAEKSSIPPILAVWFPNFVFGILAFYLLRNARR
jgi:lipopolysaccharide export system permease protein